MSKSNRCFHRFFIAIFLLILLIQSVSAQGILDVYQQALISDPQLKQAGFDRDANLEAKPQAKALLLPSLGAGASIRRTFNESDDRLSDRDFNSRSLSLQLVQSIYNRKNRKRVEQADAIVDQANANFSTAELDLLVRVVNAYFNVLARQDDLTFILADKNAIEKQLTQAQQRFEVGLITITDVQEAQARFTLATSNEIAARNSLFSARQALREITGELYDELHILSNRMPLELPDPNDPDAWVELALQTSPLVQSAAFGVQAARDSIDIQKADRLPELDLVSSIGSSDDSNRDRVDTAQIGVELSIRLYEGGAISSRIREAAFLHESAKEFLETQQRATVRQIRDSFNGVQASISQVKALAEAVVANKSGLEATQAGFEVGTRTIVDVLDAQRDLFSAQRDFAIARYNYILSLVALKQAAGSLSEAEMVRINKWLEPPNEKNLAAQAEIYENYLK